MFSSLHLSTRSPLGIGAKLLIRDNNIQVEANKKIIDQGALLAQFRAIETAPLSRFAPTPETTPAPVVAPQTSVSAPATGGGGQEIQITSNVVIEEETIATTVQKVNTRLQQQGKTFAIR